MFPLSLGMAVAIRIGFRMGQENSLAAKQATKSALLIGILIAAFTGTLTIFGRGFIVTLYTQDSEVIAVATGLLLYAALFQLSDAIQAISANALRGYKDTKAMSYITFCAYWLFGLPTGLILGRTDWLTDEPLLATGFWIGFIVGLSSAAIMLGTRLYFIQKRHSDLTA
jgi:MATE family multidrug resistance protein